MATVLSHQQLQQHHHQVQHLQSQIHYPIHHHQIPVQHHQHQNNNNTSPQQGQGSHLDNQNHHHHQLQNSQQQQQQTQSDHFCKDCSVMFESSTSLEVHLSYHKENLLTRWATQDSSDNKTSPLITIANTSTSSPSPRSDHRSSDREINTNTSNTSDSSTSSQQYFNPMESHGQYLPPLYNNNTGDHNMEPTYRPNSGSSANSGSNFGGQTPVDTHNTGGGNNIPYEGFHNSYHPPTGLGHNNHPLFSPNSTNNSGPPNGNSEHQPGVGRGPEQAARESAEILDLDSHKVHIYQHQQQQQQQQLGLGERSFFHRPYLPHLQQQPPPPPVNGWPTDHHGFGARFALSPAGYPLEHPPPGAFYAPPMPPTTRNGASPATAYEITRVENPNAVGGYAPQHSPMNYPSQPPPPPSANISSSVLQSHLQVNNGLSQGFVQQQMHSPYPPIIPPQQAVVIKSDNSSSSLSPGAMPMTKAQRSPQERGGRGQQTPAAGVKTKGWKGGECKRPKTYNCPACNKWFTSSGHLKRHYGTTLHKNSVKQLGDNPEDVIKPVTKGKKALAKAQAERAQMASLNSSPKMMEDSSSNGKSNPMYIPGPQMEVNNGGPPLLNGDLGNNKPSPNFSLNPPVPISSPRAFAPNNIPPGQLGYHPYAPPSNSFIPNQNHHHNNVIPQQLQSPQIAYTNGYVLDLVPSAPPMYTSGNGYGHPPTTEDSSVPLPPFSSVGQSHYEGGPPLVHPNQQGPQQGNPNGNGNNNMDNNGFPPNHQNPNRVTPPYHHPSMQQLQQQQQNQNQRPQMNSTPSPHNSVTGGMNNSGSGHHETSFDSERDNPTGSPCDEIRSDSGSGSMEGSLDGMDNSESEGGSPNSSNSDFTKDQTENTERTGGGEVLKCPDCSKTFGRACYLTQHTNSSHSGGKPFKCDVCGKRFPQAPALSDHVAKHGSDKPYKCELCPKQFNHKTDLRRHLCLHTGEKPFTCGQCGKGFIRKDHMTKHCETHRKKTNSNNNSSN